YHRQIAQCNLKLGNLFLSCGHPDSALHYAQVALRCLLPKVPLEGDLSSPPLEMLYSENTLSSAFKIKILSIRAILNRSPQSTELLKLCIENCDLLFYNDEILRSEYDFDESKLYRQERNREYFEIALWAAYRLKGLTNDPTLTERAFQYSELARERLLIEQMQDREKAALASESIRKQLTSLWERRTKVQIQYYKNLNTHVIDSLEALFFEAHLNWKNLLNSIEQPNDNSAPLQLPRTDLAALQRLLPENQAILEYFTGDSAIYIFLLTGQSMQFLQLPRTPLMNAAIQSLRNSIIDVQLEKNLPQFSQSAAQLYGALLSRPLSILPQSVNHLVIIPDELLSDVPFELLGATSQSKNFKDFPYLLRRYSVSYANSGRLLLKQSEAADRMDLPSAVPFIGFAPQYLPGDKRRDPISGPASQPDDVDLPMTRDGVKEIAELLQGKAYLGYSASERAFKQQSTHGKILHLSMHALLNKNNPLFSRLLFTQNLQDTFEDNDLYAVELYGIQLDAKMAVLVGCETGLGQIRQGEGVMSLARAFAYAGVPATLMSLWEVKDGTTNKLMLEYYQQLKAGARKDDALRQAKLNYLEKCDPILVNPYFWGGFIASGNMSPLFPK
ncbi:MAG: CHAT domain-containing protein, partial [Saprospiraceae bacterium]